MGKLLRKIRKMADEANRRRKEQKIPKLDHSLLGIGATMSPPLVYLAKEDSGEIVPASDEDPIPDPDNLRMVGGL